MDVDSINVVSNTEATEPFIAVDEQKRHRDIFNNHMLKLLDDGKINKIMKQVDYDDSIKLMEKVTEITKENRKRYYYLINKYQVLKIGETKRLVKKTENKTEIQYYAYAEELFNILKEVHTVVGHGSLHKTQLSGIKNYANITREIIQLYNSLCEACIRKNTKKGYKNSVVKPIISEDFLCRSQVDLIDMQSASDGPWNWIMNYQDHHTKFCVLKALTHMFPVNGFGVCKQILIKIEEVNLLKTLSVREMARLCSNGTGQGYIKCSCQGSCDKSCKCKKSNQVCNSRCHGKKANVKCTNH
jgi:hypothetical protein